MKDIFNYFIILLLLLFYSCHNYDEKEYLNAACKELNTVVVKQMERSFCEENRDLCFHYQKFSYCDKYKNIARTLDINMCKRSILFDFDLEHKRVDRDYKTILENNTLELTTPYCKFNFVETELELCIVLNNFFIERLAATGKDDANLEIEKHRAIFKSEDENYCLTKHTSNNEFRKYYFTNYGKCIRKFVDSDFDELKKYVGKELDCK